MRAELVAEDPIEVHIQVSEMFKNYKFLSIR